MFKKFRARVKRQTSSSASSLNELPRRDSGSDVAEQALTGPLDPSHTDPYRHGFSANEGRGTRASVASKFEIAQSGLAIPFQRSRQSSRDRRDDPRGLTILYNPPEPRSIDIIFVHGLGGSSHKTWCKNQDRDLFWPKLWLPAEPELGSARIMTYGYDAHFASTGPTSVSNITDFAKALLYDMKFGHDDEAQSLLLGEVPIIFVVHSMGGLVFKRAYLMGQSNPDYCDIVRQIQAVLFLSTPHRGTNLAIILNRILSVSFAGHSQKQYISDLNKNSSALEDLNENFRNVAPQIRIFSFYETLETNVSFKSLLVLEKDSSILGYPGEISRPLDADHHAVCKFSNAQDPSYKSITAALKSLVSDHACTGRGQTPSRSETELQLVLKLLSSPGNAEEDFDELQNRWRPGTCNALLKAAAFDEWATIHDRPSILWAYARPGSGKSIHSSFLIRHLKESGCHCAYFFFKHLDSTKRSVKTCLLSIARQLAEALPVYRRALTTLYQNGLRLDTADAKGVWQKLFVSALSDVEYTRPIYWVIDALDECDSPTFILEILANISTVLIPIKLFTTSRPLPTINHAFSRFTSSPILHITLDDNTADIRFCADLEVQHMLGSEAVKEDVVNQVVERAEGNFLWVHLAIKQLRHCHSPDEIQDMLQTLPSGMDALYGRMEVNISHLNRASDKELSRTILTWSVFARRPLSKVELLQVLGPEFAQPLDFEHMINELCGHFVVLNANGRVTLVHQTAREYLIKATELPFSLKPEVAHEALFTRAIFPFLDTSVRSRLRKTPMPPFYEYAATSWPYHLSSTSSAADTVLDTLIKFFRGNQALSWIQALAMIGQLKVMVYASRHLHAFLEKRKKFDASRMPLLHRLSDISFLEGWTTDILRIAGKFGAQLLQDPLVIHRVIPAFCPTSSKIHHFAKRSNLGISVTGNIESDWDDRITRVSVGHGQKASMVLCQGRYLAVSTLSGTIFIWNTLTFEMMLRLEHQQHLFKFCFSNSSETIAAYGVTNTILWDVSNGKRRCTLSSISGLRPLCMAFTADDSTLMIASDTRRLLRANLDRQCVAAEWETFNEKVMEETTSISGAFLNSPTALAFSPDLSELAVAYRGFPLTVWSMDDAQPISRCRRRTEASQAAQSTWSGVNRLCWHPTKGDVLGIYTDGTVFKWHPVEETHEELKTSDSDGTPSEIECSPEGTVFATSDVNGSIRLYNFHHLAMIYQLSSEDIVTAICFATDGRRFYDLRGSFCDAWEPNALTRLADTEDRTPDADTEVGSTIVSLSNSEAFADPQIAMTALEIDTQEALIFTGDEEGSVEVFDFDCKKLQVISNSDTQMCIDHLTASPNGDLIAYTNLEGKLIILTKREIFGVASRPSQTYRVVSEAELDPSLGPVSQLLFSDDSLNLLVVGRASAEAWVLGGKSPSKTSLADLPKGRWMNHPWKHTHLIAVTSSVMYEYDWATLETRQNWSMEFPEESATIEDNRNESRPSLTRDDTSKQALTILNPTSLEVKDMLTSRDLSSLIVSVTRTATNMRGHSATYIVDLKLLRSESSIPSPILQARSLPTSVAHRMLKPLAMLKPDELIFLDTSFWVCTWRSGASASSAQADIVRRFFLPTDWVSGGSVDMCRMISDGSLVLVKGKDVIVIRSSVAAEW